MLRLHHRCAGGSLQHPWFRLIWVDSVTAKLKPKPYRRSFPWQGRGCSKASDVIERLLQKVQPKLKLLQSSNTCSRILRCHGPREGACISPRRTQNSRGPANQVVQPKLHHGASKQLDDSCITALQANIFSGLAWRTKELAPLSCICLFACWDSLHFKRSVGRPVCPEEASN